MTMAAEIPPEGIFSLLDTDLYKLTMQCAVLKYFPQAKVEYAFTNRTPDMRLNREAFDWLRKQVDKLGKISVTDEEFQYLRSQCSYLDPAHLHYLQTFRLRPAEQVQLQFDSVNASDIGDLHITVKGLWVETILYEIPLLALTSEAYFKFCNQDWNHDGQEQKAYDKGVALLEHGCMVSEFGSRRRRDYKTQDLVIQGLVRASKTSGMSGQLTGTSNVHFAMRYGVTPVGTVAHEWYMGIAAITNNYEDANALALSYWVGTFGVGVLGVALTDTFGTPAFFNAFQKPCRLVTTAARGSAVTLPSAGRETSQPQGDGLATAISPLEAPLKKSADAGQSYAHVFTGIRQDSGDPVQYIRDARKFYDSMGITGKKTVVFSDSLNIDRCLEYKKVAEEASFAPSFGVGTFFTNDFVHTSDGKKSVPLNIVIKLSYACGRPAVKISDNAGKNTGDSRTVEEVKARLGYVEKDWKGGDEAGRWGKEGE